MFRTKSVGVKRLSLILGFVGGCYFLKYHEPITGATWGNIANMVLLFVTGFIVTWLVVRIIAWVVEGFMKDRDKLN